MHLYSVLFYSHFKQTISGHRNVHFLCFNLLSLFYSINLDAHFWIILHLVNIISIEVNRHKKAGTLLDLGEMTVVLTVMT